MLSARYAYVVLVAEHSAVRQALKTLVDWTQHHTPLPENLLNFLLSFTGERHQAKDRALFRLMSTRSGTLEQKVATIEQEQKNAESLLHALCALASRVHLDATINLDALKAVALRYQQAAIQHLDQEAALMEQAWGVLKAEDWFRLASHFANIDAVHPLAAGMVYEPAHRSTHLSKPAAKLSLVPTPDNSLSGSLAPAQEAMKSDASGDAYVSPRRVAQHR